jgi:hypothetical protein
LTSEARRGIEKEEEEHDKKEGVLVTRKWKQVKEKRLQNRKRRRNKWKTRLPIVYSVT